MTYLIYAAGAIATASYIGGGIFYAYATERNSRMKQAKWAVGTGASAVAIFGAAVIAHTLWSF